MSEYRKIGIIGLGYVGLPLALEFSKYVSLVVGYDSNFQRIDELKRGYDKTNEVSDEDLGSSLDSLTFTADPEDLSDCNFYIVTVPTPIDKANEPDLTHLIDASTLIGGLLSKGDVVVYESTVYPGATQECCIPILEKHSGLKLNQDFGVGYSPERINPGDPKNKLPNIKKLVAGSSPQISEQLVGLYNLIIKAGLHVCSSIEVAEAAKAIENTQRDINIALVNEISMLLGNLGIDAVEVLEAAGTKWNFLAFRPGLVGGHCIGVDPYYLIHKAKTINFHSQVIGAGRRVNDYMPIELAQRFLKKLSMNGIKLHGASVLILGVTFKENCPDLRNSKVFNLIDELHSYGVKISIFDPIAPLEFDSASNFTKLDAMKPDYYDGIILAVPHSQFTSLPASSIRNLSLKDHIFMDLKAVYKKTESDLRA
jgi:UDP-N-acetyl-D-galactosamine dehydrogenase